MSPKRKREQQVVTGFLGLVFLVVMVGFGLMTVTVMLNTASSSDEINFMPTAEFLEQHPLDLPTFIHVNADCVGESQHCFRLQPEALVGRSDGFVFSDMTNRLSALNLKIDGHYVNSGGFVMGSEIYGNVPVQHLSEGLHLAELSIADSTGNIHQHTWAFRIGSASGAAVPTLAVPPTHATPTP